MKTHLSAPASRGSGIGSILRALGRCLLLLALWPVSIALFIAVWLAAALIPLGFGILLVPVAVKAMRSLAGWKRRMANQWSGIRVESLYLPLPPAEPGFRGRFKEDMWLLKDPGTWRDFAWLFMDLCVSAVLACLGLATVIGGLSGLALPIIWGPFAKNWLNNNLFLFVPVNDATVPFMPIPGLLFLLVGLLLAPCWVNLHSRFVRWALGPTKRTRMAALSQTRRETRDSSAAGLRRIERDLHDGRGGASPGAGTGLRGIERRLAAFDGVLAVQSPLGGPTSVHITLPIES